MRAARALWPPPGGRPWLTQASLGARHPLLLFFFNNKFIFLLVLNLPTYRVTSSAHPVKASSSHTLWVWRCLLPLLVPSTSGIGSSVAGRLKWRTLICFWLTTPSLKCSPASVLITILAVTSVCLSTVQWLRPPLWGSVCPHPAPSPYCVLSPYI